MARNAKPAEVANPRRRHQARIDALHTRLGGSAADVSVEALTEALLAAKVQAEAALAHAIAAHAAEVSAMQAAHAAAQGALQQALDRQVQLHSQLAADLARQRADADAAAARAAAAQADLESKRQALTLELEHAHAYAVAVAVPNGHRSFERRGGGGERPRRQLTRIACRSARWPWPPGGRGQKPSPCGIGASGGGSTGARDSCRFSRCRGRSDQRRHGRQGRLDRGAGSRASRSRARVRTSRRRAGGTPGRPGCCSGFTHPV